MLLCCAGIFGRGFPELVCFCLDDIGRCSDGKEGDVDTVDGSVSVDELLVSSGDTRGDDCDGLIKPLLAGEGVRLLVLGPNNALRSFTLGVLSPFEAETLGGESDDISMS